MQTSVVAALFSCLSRLTALLLALQVCTLILGTEGLWVKWEDDSKSLQSSLFLGPQVCMVACGHSGTKLSLTADCDGSLQLFAEYLCPWVRRPVGLTFGVLLDTLSVFQSSLSSSDLVMKFPGANEELNCE